MHEYDYMLPPQALWEWDDGQSMYPPNVDEPMVIYRGADSKFTLPAEEPPEVGEGTLVLTIRARDGRKVWSSEMNDITEEVSVPENVTRDMKEGRRYYFYDIMLVTENGREIVQPVTPVWVYPTAGGTQYE